MILTTLLFGATVLLGAGLIATFWNNITEWLKKAVQKVKEIVNAVVVGAKIFIKKIGEGFKEISKHYSKKGIKWQETIVTKEISASEVPDEIKQKAGLVETDITSDYELALQNA